MRRLTPGCHLTAPDGRRMTVTRIETVDGIPHIWWAESGHGEGTLLAAITLNTAPPHRFSRTANGHSKAAA